MCAHTFPAHSGSRNSLANPLDIPHGSVKVLLKQQATYLFCNQGSTQSSFFSVTQRGNHPPSPLPPPICSAVLFASCVRERSHVRRRSEFLPPQNVFTEESPSLRPDSQLPLGGCSVRLQTRPRESDIYYRPREDLASLLRARWALLSAFFFKLSCGTSGSWLNGNGARHEGDVQTGEASERPCVRVCIWFVGRDPGQGPKHLNGLSICVKGTCQPDVEPLRQC